MVAYVSRRWRPDDVPFLWDVLYLSIHVKDGWEQPPRSILDDHALAHYLRDFGTWEGDDAQVVCTDGGEPVAAAYCRRMRADDPGWGFVEEGIPEFGMAVLPEHRGRGLGRRVLTDLLERHPLMSLSVDFDNHVARRLYESLGFEPVGDDGNSLTMIRRPAASHDRHESGT